MKVFEGCVAECIDNQCCQTSVGTIGALQSRIAMDRFILVDSSGDIHIVCDTCVKFRYASSEIWRQLRDKGHIQ